MFGISKSIVKSTKGILDKAYASEACVKSAAYRVRRELKGMGLLFDKSRLSKVQVIYEGLTYNGFASFKGIMGFYDPLTRNIHIPAMWPAVLLPEVLPWYHDRCMADVLRHEFGHALEGKYSKFFHDERFIKAFGDEYGENHVAKDGDERNYVSKYARTCTQEDFTETFMLFMKHKAVLPREFARRKAIRTKWETVAAICQDIAKMKK